MFTVKYTGFNNQISLNNTPNEYLRLASSEISRFFGYNPYNGEIQRIREFIQSGHDVNVKGKGGWTALHWAVSSNKEEIVEILLAAGASPDIKTDDNQTARTLAADADNQTLLIMLDKQKSSNETAQPKFVEKTSSVLTMFDNPQEINKNAQSAYKNCNYEEALRLFTRLAELQPNNPVALNFKGLALSALGRHQEAIDLYKTCLSNNKLKKQFSEFQKNLTAAQEALKKSKLPGLEAKKQENDGSNNTVKNTYLGRCTL